METRRLQVVMQRARLAGYVLIVIVQRGNPNVVGRDLWREDDAIIVMVLLDASGEEASDSDAVASHDDGALFAILRRKVRAERLAVSRSKLEDMSDFDSAPRRHWRTALRAQVAHLGQGNVRHDVSLEVSTVVGVPQVVAVFVGADHEVCSRQHRVVRDDPNPVYPNWRRGSRHQSSAGDFVLGGDSEIGGRVQGIRKLDLVHVQITANDYKHEFAVCAVEHCFEGLGGGHSKEIR